MTGKKLEKDQYIKERIADAIAPTKRDWRNLFTETRKTYSKHKTVIEKLLRTVRKSTRKGIVQGVILLN